MRALLRAVGGVILGALAFAGAAHAQISEPGPYYSLPSWDQQFPASTRWVVLTNWGSAAVLDRETGLVWRQNPSANTKASWDNVLGTCQGAAIGGRMGWRLPAVEELTTLMDPATFTLFAGAPFTLPSGGPGFWTATTVPGDATSAESVTFETSFGGVSSTRKPAAFTIGASEATRARRTRNNRRSAEHTGGRRL